jgi:predicted nuclease of restriction endonuclease-like (RecB) superfamily
MTEGFRLDYPAFFKQIKTRIQSAQVRAVFAVNAELLHLYWDVGRTLTDQQVKAGWGARVLERLATDLKNELPEVKGFSERNLKLMTQFYREYGDLFSKGQSAVAPLKAFFNKNREGEKPHLSPMEKGQPVIAQLPWTHNVVLMQKIKDKHTRYWYAQKTLENGWSRNVLGLMITGEAHKREGRALTNFKERMPLPQSDLAQQTLKDPYIFDFLTLEEPFHERELETGLLHHLEKFLLELGRGFAFVGRQYHVEVGAEDFYIDLLFYHLHLRSFVVIELKKGNFKAEYAGKMNFYCNVVDDHLKKEGDNPTIGLILCQNKNRLVAEFMLGSYLCWLCPLFLSSTPCLDIT